MVHDQEKLSKAPLKEVIFEARWQMDVLEDSNETDPGHDVAIGALRKLSENKFPVHKRRFDSSIPYQFLKNQVTHQYWTNEDDWPVMQLGPGVFTFNDTNKNYDWKEMYYPSLIESINWLYESYEENLNVNLVMLKYIDTVNIADYGFEGDWQGFINKYFKFNFYNDFSTTGRLGHLDFNQYLI